MANELELFLSISFQLITLQQVCGEVVCSVYRQSNPLYFANTAFIRFSSNKQSEKTTNKRERDSINDNIETENTANINILWSN